MHSSPWKLFYSQWLLSLGWKIRACSYCRCTVYGVYVFNCIYIYKHTVFVYILFMGYCAMDVNVFISWHLGYQHVIQWLFLVPPKGGRQHIIPQLAVYTTYIPLIYCLLGGYIIPTTLYRNLKNPLMSLFMSFANPCPCLFSHPHGAACRRVASLFAGHQACFGWSHVDKI